MKFQSEKIWDEFDSHNKFSGVTLRCHIVNPASFYIRDDICIWYMTLMCNGEDTYIWYSTLISLTKKGKLVSGEV